MYTFTYLYVYIYIHIRIYINTYIYLYIHTHIQIDVRMFALEHDPSTQCVAVHGAVRVAVCCSVLQHNTHLAGASKVHRRGRERCKEQPLLLLVFFLTSQCATQLTISNYCRADF